MNKAIEFVIKYVWQFPQMLVAYIWYLYTRKKLIERIESDEYIVYRGTNKGGVTLGNRIFLSEKYKGEYLQLIIAHENGHVKQSKYLGPLYLFVIGIPSLLWAWLHKSIAPKKSYYSLYTEAWANKLGGVALTEEKTLIWAHLVRK